MLIFSIDQVWQYYLLPEEEQRMPGVKNPMCNTFPRWIMIMIRLSGSEERIESFQNRLL